MTEPVRRFMNNLGTIVLALLLAFVVWISATLQADPFDVQEFPNVPITLLHQPEDTVLLQSIVEQVSITARAPQSVLAELEVSDFEATMDLSAVPPGALASVPVQVSCRDETVRIQAWNPSEQTVRLESVLVLTTPVAVEVTGEVATGYQSSPSVIIPARVAVQGPKSLLDQVVSVSGSVSVEGVKEDVVEQVAVMPLDAQGRLVPGLQWSPDHVQVEIGVRRKLGYKPDVEVVPDLRGVPAQGYRLGTVTVEPSTVTLAGLPSILNELPGFVETWPITVTEATENLFEYSSLNVPNSVVVIGVDFVTVTVEVLPIQSSRAMTVSVEIQGVRPGWTATPSPNVVDVILEGPDTKLDEMTPDDVRVVLEVFGYELGAQRVEPTVITPEGISAVSVIPETIEVVLALTPTATPTATITATLTVQP